MRHLQHIRKSGEQRTETNEELSIREYHHVAGMMIIGAGIIRPESLDRGEAEMLAVYRKLHGENPDEHAERKHRLSQIATGEAVWLAVPLDTNGHRYEYYRSHELTHVVLQEDSGECQIYAHTSGAEPADLTGDQFVSLLEAVKLVEEIN